MGRKLHIYHRHVHSKADSTSRDPNKVRPIWFSYEACFRNLLLTILQDPDGSEVSVTLMFDGHISDFVNDFSSRYFFRQDTKIDLQLIEAGSDGNSAMITFGYVNHAELIPGDIVYILENDYMHVPGWISKVFELYDSGIKFDYLSLYDHRDKYFLPMYTGLRSQLFHSQTHHWRTAPSTCGSFLAEVSTFRADYDVFLRELKDYFLFKALIEERNRVLLTPVPGLATHCMDGYLSPTIDWTAFVF